MGGCYGDSIYNRYWERRLDEYLDSQEDEEEDEDNEDNE